MTAGPTPVPEFVLAAMAGSVHYHRSPAFSEIVRSCREKLPKIFSTEQEVLIFSGSGTLAMEGAVANFFNENDKVLSVNSGKFGARWTEQARIYGCDVHEIFVERGQAVDVSKVEEYLKQTPDCRGVFIHASETSTGVRHDVKKVAQMAQKLEDCLTLVDAVTAIGVFEVPMDRWGLDVVVGGSQKGFMLPPGLSFGAASERAWKRSQNVNNVRYYMDWRKEKKAAEKNTGAFTSAVTLIGGLESVLKYFESEGYDNLYKRRWKLAFATREAIKALGAELLVKDDHCVSPACTAVMTDGLFSGTEITQKYGFTMSGGQDELKGKIIRIGHIGYIDGWDALGQVMAVGRLLEAKGKNISLSSAVEAFWKVAESDKDWTPEDLR